jgi:hypothetical protein
MKFLNYKPETVLNSCIRYAAGMLAFLLINSCNPEEWEVVDCSECYTDKPEMAEINVRVSISNLNPSVVVNVYSGRVEEEILVVSETVRTGTWRTILPVDEYYSVTATYRAQTGSYMVTAIDGGMVRTRKVNAACNEPCWTVRGNNFNVTLGY